MHLVYVDDSGHRPDSFVLSALLVPAAAWNYVLDQLVAFRRELASQQGYRTHAELHATDFPAGGGEWWRLKAPPRTRWGVYKRALGVLGGLADTVCAFAVAVPDLTLPRFTDPDHARGSAWTLLLERLERFTERRDTTCLLIADTGNQLTFRQLARRKRRFGPVPSAYGPQTLDRPFRRLVEDPWFRESTESYFLQWADLIAYAAFRTVQPTSSIPASLWQALGPAVLAEANRIQRLEKGSDEPPGLIIYPTRRLP